MPIRKDATKLDFGRKIELFEVDATSLGMPQPVRLTPNMPLGTYPKAEFLLFRGMAFTVHTFETDGFEWNQDGSFPRPTVTISDENGWLSDEVEQHDDFVGAQVRRWITKPEYLDNGTVPTGSAFGPEIWTVNAKVECRHGLFVKFQLASEIDARKAMIPRRVMLRKEFPALGLVKIR